VTDTKKVATGAVTGNVKFTKELCDRLICKMYLEKMVKEFVQHSAYSTSSYLEPGEQASAVLNGHRQVREALVKDTQRLASEVQGSNCSHSSPRDRSIFATFCDAPPASHGSIAPLRDRGEPPRRDFAHTTYDIQVTVKVPTPTPKTPKSAAKKRPAAATAAAAGTPEAGPSRKLTRAPAAKITDDDDDFA
jgi:hypothetical protein